MKVKGLDGKEHSLYLVDYQAKPSDDRPRSDLHLEVRSLLRTLYPSHRLLEEVPLPGSGGLYVDFFLPQLKLAVEAHGRQHYEYVPFFHGKDDVMGFLNSKKRDANKVRWFEINQITLVVCSYAEAKDVWKKRITSS